MSIYSYLGEEGLDEFVEVINRGRPAGYRPGAVDLTEYEVRRRTEDQILQTVTVDHLRSNGAGRLARLALDALDDGERPLGSLDIALARAGVELGAVTLAVRDCGGADIQQLRVAEAELESQVGVRVQFVVVPGGRHRSAE